MCIRFGITLFGLNFTPFDTQVVLQLGDEDEDDVVCRTPVIKKTLNPCWEPVTMKVMTCGRADQQLKVLCKVYQNQRVSKLKGSKI